MPITHPQKKNVSLGQVLATLLDDQNIFPPAYLRHFSDLEGADLESLRSVWLQVKAHRRLALLEDLEELAEVDTLVSFDQVARMALADDDPRVRTVAVRLLWEDEDHRLAPTFIKMMHEDPDADVRAAAASALGLFVYLGELEEIPEDVLHQVEESLLQVQAGQDEPLIRRRALEALGFSGRLEVPGLIRAAYNSSDTDWMASSLFAIGRSADNAWEPEVLRALRYPKANVQLEAVRAAGALELEKSRRALLDLLEEEAQDSDIRAAIFWSLSQIGGEEVRETLETILEETEDEEEAEIIEDALDNLSFTEDVGLYGLFDFANAGEMDAGELGDRDDLDDGLTLDGSDEETGSDED
jgi:HEAT repeat protein